MGWHVWARALSLCLACTLSACGRSDVAVPSVQPADRQASVAPGDGPTAFPPGTSWASARTVLRQAMDAHADGAAGWRGGGSAVLLHADGGETHIVAYTGRRDEGPGLELWLQADDGPPAAKIKALGTAWIAHFGCDARLTWKDAGVSLATWTAVLEDLRRAQADATPFVEVHAEDDVPAANVLAFLAAARDAGIKDLRVEVTERRRCEDAIEDPLRWLAAHQLPDGSWNDDLALAYCDGLRMRGVTIDAADAETTGLTGLVLVSFLGTGYTNRGRHPFARIVSMGLRYLKTCQDPEGGFSPEGSIRAHAWAALAMVEAYGMTGSLIFKRSAQRGLSWLQEAWPESERDALSTLLTTMCRRSAQLINRDSVKRGQPASLSMEEAPQAQLHAEAIRLSTSEDDFSAAAGLVARLLLGDRWEDHAEIGERALRLVQALEAKGAHADPGLMWLTAWTTGAARDECLDGILLRFRKAHGYGGNRQDGHPCCFKGSSDPRPEASVEGGRVTATALFSLGRNILSNFNCPYGPCRSVVGD